MGGRLVEDHEAIQQLKAGNLAGLRTLVERYQVQAVQTAALVLQDRAAAEDIVQNAFLRCYERIDQFDADRPFRPWFLRIVINDAVKASVRRKDQISLDHQEDDLFQALIERLESSTLPPEEAVQQSEIRAAIRDALMKISPKQRAVILQKYFLGMNEKEMSAALNCAPGTVKWHLNAGRRKLQSLLQKLIG